MPDRVRTVFTDNSENIVKTSREPTGAHSNSNSRGKKRKRSDDLSAKNNAEQSKDAPSIPGDGSTENPTKSKARHESPKFIVKDMSSAPKSKSSYSSLKQKSEALLRFRKELPIWSSAHLIRSSLRGPRDVLILAGETGSGKSTQVPQFLMTEPWCKNCIAITQPRRVAAISLARRVAEEIGTPLGSSSPASKVGYAVRFDKSHSPSTKIKFLTEGMLLQEMFLDPALRKYSAVIVDEVHERSVNVDLILGFLRKLVTEKKGRGGKPLKVVVMSATADVASLIDFFTAGYEKDVAQQEVSLGDIRMDSLPTQERALPESNDIIRNLLNKSKHVASCFISGRQFHVDVTYLSAPTQDFIESALKCAFEIHYKQPLPGDILVFLTGQDAIETLERLINEYADAMGPEVPKILVLPLFAALPQAAQQMVFQPSLYNTRKIILSTNIAETSVTVPGVRYVIDSGKMKIKQFRNRLGLESLLVKPISKSSAIQRKGRAGRESAGHCYRLYTEQDYENLQQDGTPEILRCDLSDALLGMKARRINDVLNFPFLNPPPREAMEKALLQLFQLNTLNDNGEISNIGRLMAQLPLAPPLGRAIVEASDKNQDCLLDIIDIIACLTVETIFLNLTTEEAREEAEAARRELLRRDGDHLTLLCAVRAYAAENTDRKSWSERYFVSHRAMQNVMDVRKQLFSLCKQFRLLDESATLNSSDLPSSESRNEEILKCLLKGFSGNTARIMPDGSYKTLHGNQTVAIHPSSVLFGRKVEAILFTEYVFTTKSYGRNVSAVRLSWIDEILSS